MTDKQFHEKLGGALSMGSIQNWRTGKKRHIYDAILRGFDRNEDFKEGESLPDFCHRVAGMTMTKACALIGVPRRQAYQWHKRITKAGKSKRNIIRFAVLGVANEHKTL
jgi:hypothetical protein